MGGILFSLTSHLFIFYSEKNHIKIFWNMGKKEKNTTQVITVSILMYFLDFFLCIVKIIVSIYIIFIFSVNVS
jgi:hypothetical protein